MAMIAGLSDAQAVLRANISPRAAHIERLESFVEGTQYRGMPDWFEADVQLWKKAPCISYPIVKSAIDSNTDLVLADGRFPAFTTHPDEDDSIFDDAGLNTEDSAVMDRLLAGISKQVRFKSACREIFSSAQGAGSGVAMFGVRAEKLFMDSTKARWCVPTFAHDGSVDTLEISYPYLEEFRDESGKWRVSAKLYRRVIDSQLDTTFLPADANTSGIQPIWKRDPLQTFEHGFGFCPVVWYAFMRGCSAVNKFDGQAIHTNYLDEVRALDMALSQRHRAALYAGDPQWTEIGVEQGYTPTGKARGMAMPATAAGGVASASNPVTSGYRDTSRVTQGRKKSPGDVWQYEAPDAKVTLHTLPGDALTAIDNHARDLRIKLAESLAVVFLDEEHVSSRGAVLSGRALEALKSRQLDRCDQYRSDVGDKLILPSLDMLLRVTKKSIESGRPLRLAGISKAFPILKRFDIADEAA